MKRLAQFLCQYEIWFVAAFLGASVIQVGFLFPAVAAILIFWPVRRVAAGQWGARTPVDVAGLLLVAMLPVTLWASAIPEITVPQVLRLLTGIGFFYAIINWAGTPRRVQGLAWGVGAAAVGLAAFALVSAAWAQGKFAFIPAALVSDSIHPNVLGGSLALLMSGLGAVFLWGLGKISWVRLLAGAVIFSGMAGVLWVSQSRGALLALGLASLLLVALRWRWGILGFVAAGAAGWALLLRLGGADLLAGLMFGHGVSGGIGGRLELWQRAIYMIQDFPWTGVGMGLYGEAAENLYPLVLFEGTVPHAHNLVLQVGVDLGLPGLVAWLAIFLLVCRAGWRLYRMGRRDGSAWLAGLGAGAMGVQVVLMVHGIFDAVTWGMVRPAPLVWGLWGVVIAALRVAEAGKGES